MDQEPAIRSHQFFAENLPTPIGDHVGSLQACSVDRGSLPRSRGHENVQAKRIATCEIRKHDEIRNGEVIHYPVRSSAARRLFIWRILR